MTDPACFVEGDDEVHIAVEDDTLPATVAVKLVSIARAKGWFNNDMTAGAIERALLALGRMADSAQRELYLWLVQKYEILGFEQYQPLLTSALRLLLNDPQFDDSDLTIFAPMKKPKDDRLARSKSGSQLPYLARIVSSSTLAGGFKGGVQAFDSVHTAVANSRAPANLVILDDFVGSGETALESLKGMAKVPESDSYQVFLCVLVAHETGVAALRNAGAKVHFAREHMRSISGDTRLDSWKVRELLSVLDDLEEMINVPKGFRRGYRGCEAVISMARTPNNTLPVFWTTRPFEGKPWPALFPR